jgi:hypothetical protein
MMRVPLNGRYATDAEDIGFSIFGIPQMMV